MEDVKVYRQRFSFAKCDVKRAGLWSVAPIWPGRARAKLTAQQLEDFLVEAYHRSSDTAHLVLWMPAAELHRTPFDPLDQAGPWLPMATLLSGAGKMTVGYIYARSRSPIAWDSKVVLDARGLRGPNSSKTVKLLLEALGNIDGPIVDPYAHKSAVLPTWARRRGHQYAGYTASKASYQEISKALAQVELPGIQLELPA